jgi:transmembrane sensor
MMASTETQIEEQAIGWIIRLTHAAASDWAAFTDWLEADPAHLEAYNRLALLDEELGGLPRSKPRPLFESERQPVRHTGRRAVAAWGVAAALLLTLGVVATRPGETSYMVATGPGEQRSVQLADGSRIDLNGSTKILLDREQPRLARLEQGEALFTVVHKETAPFQVHAGDNLIYDVGTVFNVVKSEKEVRVAVAEGEVIFNPKLEAVNLKPGMSLEKHDAKVSVSSGAIEAAGAWKEGRLIYADAPISEVAADLSRNLGVPIGVSSSVAGKTFTGLLRIEGDPQTVLTRASALIGVKAKRSNQGWNLTPE